MNNASRTVLISSPFWPTVNLTVRSTSVDDGLQFSTDLTNDIAAASAAMETWRGAAAEMSAGVTRLEGLMSGVRAFARFAGAFGVLGAALGAASSLLQLFGESEGDQTMKAIANLSDSVEHLRKQMNSRFDQLEQVLNLEAAKTVIAPHVQLIATANLLVQGIREYRPVAPPNGVDAGASGSDSGASPNPGQSGPGPEEVAAAEFCRLLMELGRWELFNAACGITRSCVSNEPNLETNLLQAIYEKTFGDVDAVVSTGSLLAGFVALASVADNLICQLQVGGHSSLLANPYAAANRNRTDPPDLGAQQALETRAQGVQFAYGRLSEQIQASLEQLYFRGASLVNKSGNSDTGSDPVIGELKANLQHRLNYLLATTQWPAGADSHNRAAMYHVAKQILDGLEEHHNWCSFLVVVFGEGCEPKEMSWDAQGSNVGVHFFNKYAFGGGNSAHVFVGWVTKHSEQLDPPHQLLAAQWKSAVLTEFASIPTNGFWPMLALGGVGGSPQFATSTFGPGLAVLDKQQQNNLLWKFVVSDLRQPATLFAKLKAPADNVSAYVHTRLSAPTMDALNRWPDDHSSDDLSGAVVADLNTIIAGDSIWNSNRFSAVNLRLENRQLAESQSPITGSSLIRFNRSLLEDAYPGELARMQKDYDYVVLAAKVGNAGAAASNSPTGDLAQNGDRVAVTLVQPRFPLPQTLQSVPKSS